MSNIFEEDEVKALKHIYNNRWGYMAKLEMDFDKKIIDSFLSVGFIKIGFTRKFKTWSITPLGNKYIEELDLDK